MSDELVKEIESLRAHNGELLGDLKKAKASAKDAQAQLEALTVERDEALARTKSVMLDKPVADMLARVSLAPELFAHQFAKEYTFVQTDDGIAVHDLEGRPAKVTDDKGKPRPAQFTEADIRKLADASPHREVFAPITVASHASGGGALGSHVAPSVNDKPKDARPSVPVFGFR